MWHPALPLCGGQGERGAPARTGSTVVPRTRPEFTTLRMQDGGSLGRQSSGIALQAASCARARGASRQGYSRWAGFLAGVDSFAMQASPREPCCFSRALHAPSRASCSRERARGRTEAGSSPGRRALEFKLSPPRSTIPYPHPPHVPTRRPPPRGPRAARPAPPPPPPPPSPPGLHPWPPPTRPCCWSQRRACAGSAPRTSPTSSCLARTRPRTTSLTAPAGRWCGARPWPVSLN